MVAISRDGRLYHVKMQFQGGLDATIIPLHLYKRATFWTVPNKKNTMLVQIIFVVASV